MKYRVLGENVIYDMGYIEPVPVIPPEEVFPKWLSYYDNTIFAPYVAPDPDNWATWNNGVWEQGLYVGDIRIKLISPPFYDNTVTKMRVTFSGVASLDLSIKDSSNMFNAIIPVSGITSGQEINFTFNSGYSADDIYQLAFNNDGNVFTISNIEFYVSSEPEPLPI